MERRFSLKILKRELVCRWHLKPGGWMRIPRLMYIEKEALCRLSSETLEHSEVSNEKK